MSNMKNPRVFFCYAWENVWRANQLKNQTRLNKNNKAKFVNKSLIEKSKAKNDQYIKRKIRNGINQAGTVVIINSPEFNNKKYANYEARYAIKKKKKLIVINTEKMKDQKGKIGEKAPKPQICRKYKIPSRTYTPRKSNLKNLILKAKKPSKRKLKV